MSNLVHCDGPGCTNTHGVPDPDNPLRRSRSGWLIVRADGTETHIGDFCSFICVGRWGYDGDEGRQAARAARAASVETPPGP